MAEVPSLYVLRGDDSARYRELIATFKAGLGDPDMADLNTTLLAGDTASIDDLTANAMAVPFLTERRLLIVEEARKFLERNQKNNKERLLKLFDDLPQSTALVLYVEDQIVKRGRNVFWENAKAYDWVLDWVKDSSGRGLLIDISLPDADDMPAWIRRRVKEQGGEIEPNAAALLAEYVGNDTLRAGHEIDKLMAYAGEGGAIKAPDVVLLTAQDQEGDIFAMVDALGERNGKKAMEQFLILTEASDVMELTGMIQRQFRLLIQAREVMDEGGHVAKVQEELKVLPFIAKKLSQQAGRFTMRQLIDIHSRLLKIDEDLKTGGMPADLAYQLLIADLTR